MVRYQFTPSTVPAHTCCPHSLRQLKVSPAAMDSAVALLQRPHLRLWLDVARARRRERDRTVAAAAGIPNLRTSSSGGGGGSGSFPSNASLPPLHPPPTAHGPPAAALSSAVAAPSRKEQTHLLALYGALCECSGTRDGAVREAACTMLLQVRRFSIMWKPERCWDQ